MVKLSKRLLALAVWVFAALSATAAMADPLFGDGGVSAFYSWTGKVPTQPGTFLRKEAMDAAPYVQASVAERILYSSRDAFDKNRAIVVSGRLFLPKGTPPKGGWPVMSWGHPTTGIADACAPSWKGDGADEIAMIDAWLAAGFAVVATDYQGLGTEGPHPYLLFKPEGIGILDAARVALKMYPGKLANKIVTAGFSQGSGAALGAAWLAPGYAPDLKLVGAIATGLVVETNHPGAAPQVATPPFADEDGSIEAAFEMLFLIGTAPALDKSFQPESALLPAGRSILKTTQTSCFGSVVREAVKDKLDYRDVPGTTNIFTADYAKIVEHIEQASPFENAHFTVPILTLTGLADEWAPISRQYNFISAMCYAGTTVEAHYYPGETHDSAVNASLPETLRFAKAVVTGAPVTGNCSTLVPPQQTPSRIPSDRRQ